MNALLVLVALLLGCGVLGRQNITTFYSDPSIVYSGSWTPASELANSIACGGSHCYSNDSSATATWQFTGVAFYYMAPQWAYPVNTIINIDNGNITTNIDLDDHALPQTGPGLAESIQCLVLWGSGELENGQHTVVASMPQGGPPFVVVDAFMYTVLDPGDVPPVAITTAETSATTITPTTAGSSASSVALGTKKSNSVSIPMVVGIAAAIGVLAIAILFFLCYRMRRAAYVNEEAEPRIYSPETPPGFQPSKLTQQSAPVPIVNAVPEPAGQHFRRNRGNPPLPVRELIDYEPAWLSGSVSELSPQTGNNQTSFGTTEAGFGAHRQTFATPTAHSLASGNATNNVAAEPWTMPRTVVFTHNNGIEVAEKQPRMGEMGINGSRAEQPDHRIDIKTVPADPPALGFQNFSPTSQNQGENHEERGKLERAFGNHQFGTHHPASDYTQIARAVVGPSHSTSQQLRPSPASLQHLEEDYRGVVPDDRTGYPLKEHYSAGDLYSKRMLRVFNEESPPQYIRKKAEW